MWISWFACGIIPVIRTALLQLRGCRGCKFAAIAKHIELQLRILAAQCSPPFTLPDEHLVDQVDLRDGFLNSDPADDNLSTVLDYATTNGVLLCDGERLHVHFNIQSDPFAGVANAELVINELKNWLKRGTLLGTFEVRKDYPRKAETVYLGLGEPVIRQVEGGRGEIVNHTVVILGVFRVNHELASCWNCPEGDYFEYQDSRGLENGGLLGLGRTLGHPRVLLKIYQTPLDEVNSIFKCSRG